MMQAIEFYLLDAGVQELDLEAVWSCLAQTCPMPKGQTLNPQIVHHIDSSGVNHIAKSSIPHLPV